MKLFRKIMVLAIIGLFIGAGITTSIAINNNKNNIIDDVDQSQTETKGSSVVCSWYDWCQSFIPTKSTLTGVELRLSRFGFIRSDLKVSIRGELDGEDLSTTTMPYNSVPLIWRLFIGFPEWIYFDIPDISVSPGETYYILLTTDGGFGLKFSFLSSYTWYSNSDPDSYINGESWFSNVMGDSPMPWMIWDPPKDFCFKTYGY